MVGYLRKGFAFACFVCSGNPAEPVLHEDKRLKPAYRGDADDAGRDGQEGSDFCREGGQPQRKM